MTSPAKAVAVECPGCGRSFTTTYRPSINLAIEEWRNEEVEEATTATCPQCGAQLDLGSMLVDYDAEGER